MTARRSYGSAVSLAAVALTIAALTAFGIFRSERSLVDAFDTGLYLQILHNVWSGFGWESSLTGEAIFLAHHFQPLLLACLPGYLAWPSAGALFALSALAVLATVVMLQRRCAARDVGNGATAALCLAFVLFPTVAFRLFFSFVPETLALPFLLAQGLLLSSAEPIRGKRLVLFAACQLLAGCAKENVWLVCAWIDVLALILGRMNWQAGLALLGVNAGAFLFLFTYWMPAHTSLQGYYGMRFYGVGPLHLTGLGSLVRTLLSNLFSLRSLQTLVVGLVVPFAALPLLSLGRNLVATLPGLLLVLAASHPQVHHTSNHYLLLALPFLMLSACEAFARRGFLQAHMIRRWLPVYLVVVPLAVSTLRSGGIADLARVARDHPETRSVAADAEAIKARLGSSPYLLVDGHLVPAFHSVRRLRTILTFVGKPAPLGPSDFAAATDVVTTFDPRSLADCRDVAKDSAVDRQEFDYERFYEYCQWVKSVAWTDVTHIETSGLYHFHR